MQREYINAYRFHIIPVHIYNMEETLGVKSLNMRR